MFFSEDMKALVELFNNHGVEYMLVGGFAVNYYGYIRMTQDIDFLLYPSCENAKKIIDALNDFGFGKAGINRELFERPGSVLHLGVEPNRIDLLTHLKGISNEQLFSNKREITLHGISMNIIAYHDLLLVKRSSERLRDQADAEELEKCGHKNDH
ncbi:hypothetical protein ACFL35_20585 [Candidatus Riflebacteria bacterium]